MKRIFITSALLVQILLSTTVLSSKANNPTEQPLDSNPVFLDDFSSDSGMWEYLGSVYRDPVNQYLVLTEPVGYQGGVAFFNNTFRTGFTANFSYRAGGGSGADGFVVFFYKQKYSSFEVGGHMAFSDGPWPDPPIIFPGYGVEFDNYYNDIHNDPSGNHIALIRDHVDTHLVYTDDLRTEDDSWHDVSVSVGYSFVRVLVDHNMVFEWIGALDRAFDCFGFCAATGADTNWHIIDDFSIEIHLPIEVPTDFPSIQEAINAASAGDTVFVKNGTYPEHVIVNKRISLIGESRDETIIDGQNSGTPLEVLADHVFVRGFTFTHSNGDGGLILTSSSNCIITENIAQFNFLNGIFLGYSSNNNEVSFNHVLNNTYDGIYLWTGSSNNTITRNIVVGHLAYGVIIHNLSNHNTITLNRIAENGGCGIVIDSSSNNRVFKNEILSNRNDWYTLGGAVWIDITSSDNVIFENNIRDNDLAVSTWGLSGSGNRIYHNNFIDNRYQTYIEGSCIWDNGCEGNYWSNYNGSDLNGDGIGDTYLPWEGVDSYPLMNLYWNPGDIDHDLDVDIFDLVRLATAYGSTSSSSNWNPHCDINEPYGTINIFDVVIIAINYGKEYSP